MDAKNLRFWLLGEPRPTALHIVAHDQKAHKIDCTTEITWKQRAESVLALDPLVVQALDDKGNVLRAIKPDEVVEATEDDETPAPAFSTDPESQRLITFAKLLSDAYKDSREFTTVAFDKLGELFTAVVKRSESQEKTISALDRMVQKLVLEKIANAAGGGGEDGELTFEQMIASFIQGKAQAAAEAAVNGAATPKEGTK